jgi:hypothetical protein
MQRVADAFVVMATSVAEQEPSTVAAQRILNLPMIPSSELNTVVDRWNDSAPESPFPAPPSVAITVLEAMNKHSASSIAVLEAESGGEYTYSELSLHSSFVASAIQGMIKK